MFFLFSSLRCSVCHPVLWAFSNNCAQWWNPKEGGSVCGTDCSPPKEATWDGTAGHRIRATFFHAGYSLNDCPQPPRRPAWIFPWILIGSPWRRKGKKGGKKVSAVAHLCQGKRKQMDEGKTLPFFFTVGCETTNIFGQRGGGGVAKQLVRQECSGWIPSKEREQRTVSSNLKWSPFVASVGVASMEFLWEGAQVTLRAKPSPRTLLPPPQNISSCVLCSANVMLRMWLSALRKKGFFFFFFS